MQPTKPHFSEVFRGRFGAPAIVSSLMVLLLATLELKNRPYDEGFPVALFIVLWLLPFSFIIVLRSVSRNVRSGGRGNVHLLRSLALLILIAWFWVELIVDQTPCFLGVPNCD